MTATLFVGLLVLVVASSTWMIYRAKDRPKEMRMMLYTKLGWTIVGAITLLWLILSGRVKL